MKKMFFKLGSAELRPSAKLIKLRHFYVVVILFTFVTMNMREYLKTSNYTLTGNTSERNRRVNRNSFVCHTEILIMTICIILLID